MHKKRLATWLYPYWQRELTALPQTSKLNLRRLQGTEAVERIRGRGGSFPYHNSWISHCAQVHASYSTQQRITDAGV